MRYTSNSLQSFLLFKPVRAAAAEAAAAAAAPAEAPTEAPAAPADAQAPAEPPAERKKPAPPARRARPRSSAARSPRSRAAITKPVLRPSDASDESDEEDPEQANVNLIREQAEQREVELRRAMGTAQATIRNQAAQIKTLEALIAKRRRVPTAVKRAVAEAQSPAVERTPAGVVVAGEALRATIEAERALVRQLLRRCGDESVRLEAQCDRVSAMGQELRERALRLGELMEQQEAALPQLQSAVEEARLSAERAGAGARAGAAPRRRRSPRPASGSPRARTALDGITELGPQLRAQRSSAPPPANEPRPASAPSRPRRRRQRRVRRRQPQPQVPRPASVALAVPDTEPIDALAAAVELEGAGAPLDSPVAGSGSSGGEGPGDGSPAEGSPAEGEAGGQPSGPEPGQAGDTEEPEPEPKPEQE